MQYFEIILVLVQIMEIIILMRFIKLVESLKKLLANTENSLKIQYDKYHYSTNRLIEKLEELVIEVENN